jgi:hypothetical protein
MQEYSCLWLTDTWPKSLQITTGTELPHAVEHRQIMNDWNSDASRTLTSLPITTLTATLHYVNRCQILIFRAVSENLHKSNTYQIFNKQTVQIPYVRCIHGPANWRGSSLALMSLWQLFWTRIYSLAEEATLASEFNCEKLTTGFVMFVRTSVCPNEMTRLPVDRLSWNMIRDFFENSPRKFNFDKILARITAIFTWRLM